MGILKLETLRLVPPTLPTQPLMQNPDILEISPMTTSSLLIASLSVPQLGIPTLRLSDLEHPGTNGSTKLSLVWDLMERRLQSSDVVTPNPTVTITVMLQENSMTAS